MTQVFLFGTLRDPEVRRIVCGRDVPAEPFELPQGQVMQANDGPVLLPEGPGVVGLLVDVDGPALERMDVYEAAFGYDRKPLAGVEVYTVAEVPEGDGPWDFATWQRDEAPLERVMARDVMEIWERNPDVSLRHAMGIVGSRAWARELASESARARPTPPTASAVATVSLQSSHARFFRLDVAQLEVPQFGGSSRALEREVFVGADAALILPYDPVRDRVALVEQFRMGPWRRGDPEPWMLEPVAGLVDFGETPEAAARREAVEEAGLTVREVLPMPAFYASPGDSTDFFHCFLGLCDLPEVAMWEGGLADEGEDIRTHVLSRADALAMVASGEIRVGPLVTMLYWLELNRASIGLT